jgi:Zn-dependent peptidase ImmA (M78 family)
MSYSRSDYKDKWRIERQAKQIRETLAVDQFTPLSPWDLAEAVPAHVFYPEDFGDAALAKRLATARWDGFGFSFPGEKTLIVLLNSSRPETRQAATLMEELSHHLLRHAPCKITRDSATGLLRRSFDRTQEDEAYDLGAATLLTKEMIQRAVSEQRLSAAAIAAEHRCSEELVLYRIKRLRLWQRYERYAA